MSTRIAAKPQPLVTRVRFSKILATPTLLLSKSQCPQLQREKETAALPIVMDSEAQYAQ